ncbi:MAG: flagellar basal body-associated FliL family protein [Spirochaetaceae bacterium]|jgi:flagellar FliL protein|nr:flagellar basal body-associated FliL family protein [Spirochaetaceae bacterium]
MSDNDDLLDGGGSEGIDSSAKKASGFAALLPNILKFVAIGIGALVFIVTVSVITYNILNKGGQSQTPGAEPASPYIGKRPEYAMFTLINTVRTRTKDVTPYSVVVDMVIGYDVNDKNAQTELNSRVYELRDFIRNFFSSKYAADLQPENEARLKQEIIEALNTRVLDSSKARIVLFNQLDVMEM